MEPTGAPSMEPTGAPPMGLPPDLLSQSTVAPPAGLAAAAPGSGLADLLGSLGGSSSVPSQIQTGATALGNQSRLLQVCSGLLELASLALL